MKSKTALAVISLVSIFAVIFMVSKGLSQPGKNGDKAEKIRRGQYLVNLGGCNDCHTPKIMTDIGVMPDSTRLLSGHPASQKLPPLPQGVIAPDKWGAVTNNDLTAWYGPWGVSFAINLTPDMATGTGAWTEASFIKAMRTGKHLGAGRAILPPMPWFNLATVTDEDLSAIFAYLKSLKPIQNEVPLPIPPAAAK